MSPLHIFWVFTASCFAFRTNGLKRNAYGSSSSKFGGKGNCTTRVYMSPIGIPKVAYRHPGTNRIEWEDIHNRLFRERILFVSQPLNDDYVNELIGALLCLDNENVEKPITLYINSPGGPMQAGLALYDTLRHIKSEIVTINIGQCNSTATLLLGGGTKGKRYGLQHSRVLLLQPSGLAQGTAEHIKIEAQHILNVKKTIIEIYSQMTNQTQQRVAQDIERDNFMSAVECKDYGLIDHIITSRDDTISSPSYESTS